MRWDHLTRDPDAETANLPGMTDPAVVRRFSAPEALDTRFYEVEARTVLNKVPSTTDLPFGWTVNPYRGCSHACTYCFARPTHEYLNFGPGRDFEKEIVVKVNAPERLRADLAKRARTPAYGDTVALGTNTDPYQWVESKYRLMPGIWEAIRDARVPGSVLTKSPLLLRDRALMLQVQANAGFEAALSVPSLDTKAWRTTEPHTPHPRARLAAVAELNRIGIPTAVLAAPIMPGINDSPAQIEALLAACTEAGAIGVRGIGLHLRGSTREVFLEWLADARPDLVDLYAELYRHGPHLPRAEQTRLSKLVERGERWGVRVVRTEGPARAARFAPGTRALSGGPADPPTPPAGRRPGTRPGASAGAPVDQLSLF